MTKISMHSRSPRRTRSLLAGAGLVLTGASLAAIGTAFLPGSAGASERKSATLNYVRSANPDAVSGVLLDEEVAIAFNAPVLPSSVGPDTILVRTGVNNGEQAHGVYVVGAFMYDRSVQRRPVIRPEAVREYFELVKGQPREDAQRSAALLIRRVESTGRLALLRVIDQKLQVKLGANAGTRLDDETTPIFGTYPAQLTDTSPGDNDPPLDLNPGDSPLEPYRTRIAGDDDLWKAYLTGGDIEAYSELAQNSEYERFYHPVDAATGAASTSSVLRQREYRRVLINRRLASRVMFVPEIPIRADFADTGYTAGRAYSLVIPASKPGVFNTVISRDDGRPLVQKDGRDFSTLFTTVPSTAPALFRDGESRTGITTLQKPRIINQTPPNGESYVDPTTDWEDPDNQFTVPIPQRRTFAIRLRFAQPLDPRTVSPTSFTVTKTGTIDAAGNETAVNVPVAVGTFLNQHRLGIVEVEITPATNLDPQSKYTVVARNLIRSLGGASFSIDVPTTFVVGPGKPPLDAIRETFTTTTNRADPSSADTLGQVTTAYWPAPALYDTSPTGPTGRLMASFMQFAGTGVGAPSDPQNPGSLIVQNLNLTAGSSIRFVTEVVDPSNQTAIGTQIEYNYTNVSMQSTLATSVGRYPLVIRSQGGIAVVNSTISVAGQAGGNGKTNTDTVNGPPTGGLGGQAGPGGWRGGDGGCAPKTNPDGTLLLDVSGNMQYDPAKFNGSDGLPGYLSSGPNTSGGGSGGFNGDREAPNTVECAGSPSPPPNEDDQQCTPARMREAGGGGGHATAGGDGAGARVSGKIHNPGGYFGGLGGKVYGRSDFGDQPKNGLFGNLGVPRLGFGAGGGGGGGGGAEDSGGASGAADGVANAADSGGGGGGGGGGGLQLSARTAITIDSSVIDASGGRGGRTFNAANADYGYGAPGGCGAGGSIWFQCYGDIIIRNGSTVTAAGGDNTNSIGYVSIKNNINDILAAAPAPGKGGSGGLGYVRFEDGTYDATSGIAADVTNSQVFGLRTDALFRPFNDPATSAVESDFQAFPGTPFVVNISQGFSRWFNTQLDTPSFAPHDNTAAAIDPPNGTLIVNPLAPDATVDVWVRSAPNNVVSTGHPDLGQATSSGNNWIFPWTRYVDCGTISRRRFLQFRVDFTLPLSYDFDATKLPYVDFLQIDVNLN
jgi:hypothetical protein